MCIEEKQRLWLQGCGLQGQLHTSGSLSSTEGSLLVNQIPNFLFHLNQFMVSWSAVSYLGTDQSKVIPLVDLIYVFVGMLDLINLERNDLVFSNGCVYFSHWVGVDFSHWFHWQYEDSFFRGFEIVVFNILDLYIIALSVVLSRISKMLTCSWLLI